MSGNLQIQLECEHRGITRLCHFTPSRNLPHIIAGMNGILATSNLENSERQVFNATDLKRLDGHKGHICCSIEYPNGWYFSTARSQEAIFKDWIILLIKRDYLWKVGTRFCPRNASAGYGSYIASGIEGFRLLYQDSITGAGNRTIQRSTTHLPSCPTDNQAEVLIPNRVKIEDITGIVVRDAKQAQNERCRLRLLGLEVNLNFYVAPTFYREDALSRAIRCGRRPEEKLFHDGDRHGR